jgi:uncharacterized protein YdhG (YjbR/CyaY superfamily)
MARQFASIDDYIESFPPEQQVALAKVRATIHDVLPGAGEKISYNIPTITVDGQSVVHFAGWKRHISLYPAPSGDAAFERAVAAYRSDRSTLKFPLGQSIPYPLIAQIVMMLAERA